MISDGGNVTALIIQLGFTHTALVEDEMRKPLNKGKEPSSSAHCGEAL
jgi:hypothetical protein